MTLSDLFGSRRMGGWATAHPPLTTWVDPPPLHSGNARKKTFFFNWGLPLRNGWGLSFRLQSGSFRFQGNTCQDRIQEILSLAPQTSQAESLVWDRAWMAGMEKGHGKEGGMNPFFVAQIQSLHWNPNTTLYTCLWNPFNNVTKISVERESMSRQMHTYTKWSLCNAQILLYICDML